VNDCPLYAHAWLVFEHPAMLHSSPLSSRERGPVRSPSRQKALQSALSSVIAIFFFWEGSLQSPLLVEVGIQRPIPLLIITLLCCFFGRVTPFPLYDGRFSLETILTSPPFRSRTDIPPPSPFKRASLSADLYLKNLCTLPSSQACSECPFDTFPLLFQDSSLSSGTSFS